jgi:hypothetical protein
MKNVFVLSLAVILGFSLVVGCAHADTTKPGPKKMKIWIKTDDGKLDKLTDENNSQGPVEEMTPEQIEQMYQNGPDHVGTILFTHSSPGCVVYCSGGKCYRVCRP